MLVHQYGIRPPTEKADLVWQQFEFAHRYRNDLIRIEQGRRDALRLAVDTYGTSLRLRSLELAAHDATEVHGTAAKAYKAARQTAKSKRNIPDDLKTTLAATKKVKAEAMQALRGARRELENNQEFVQERQRIQDVAHAMALNARDHSGLRQGTYILVEDAARASFNACTKPLLHKDRPDCHCGRNLYDGLEPNDPHFVGREHSWFVSVQLTDGPFVPEVLAGTHTFLRLVDAGGTSGGRRKHAELSLRVGSNSDRSPIFAKWRVTLHRPLPPTARVKTATVYLRRMGPKHYWMVSFTLDVAEKTRENVGGLVTLNLGWRIFDRTLRRCGYWRGSDGAEGEVAMPPWLVDAFHDVEAVQSERGQRFAYTLECLVRFFRLHQLDWFAAQRSKADSAPRPTDAPPSPATWASWKSPQRLARLVLHWRDHRVPGDTTIFEFADEWCRWNRIQWRHQTRLRMRCMGARKDLYRVEMRKLADIYDTMVLADLDLRDFAVLPELGDDEARENETARANRVIASTHELRLCAKNAFGTHVHELPADNDTQRCHVCGDATPWDAAKAVAHTCPGCGTTWDQDSNFCRNVLARTPPMDEIVRDRRAAAEAKAKRGSRWARLKREKAERQDT